MRTTDDRCWVLYHAGIGWLAMSSLRMPAQSMLLGATVDATYGIADELKLTPNLGDAARVPSFHATQARELAAKLNAREHHHRWRAVRWDHATEIERAA